MKSNEENHSMTIFETYQTQMFSNAFSTTSFEREFEFVVEIFPRRILGTFSVGVGEGFEFILLWMLLKHASSHTIGAMVAGKVPRLPAKYFKAFSVRVDATIGPLTMEMDSSNLSN